MTYQHSAPAHSIGVPTPRVITESVRRPPRVVIVVQTRGSAPSSSRYRGTNPGFGGLLESLSWCQPLLESLSWYKPGVRRPPRVTIVVQTVGLADWIGLPNPRFLWLVVDVVGGGVQSFFLRVMVGTGYPHPAQCEFAYPPRLHRLHNYTVLSIAQS